MRWQFCNLNDPQEVGEREAVIELIDAWWLEFAANTDRLDSLFSQKSDWDLPGWMDAHLQAIHPELMWEFGPAIASEGHRLVITPESAKHLRPLTVTILERAPDIAGWEFHGYRLPEDLEVTQLTVEARVDGDLENVMARVQAGQCHRVDLRFYFPEFAGEGDEQAYDVAFVATETLLGEERLDRWVGAIEVETLPSEFEKGGRAGLIPLDRLKATVDAVVGSMQDQLPATPHHAWVADAQWSVWQLDPPDADDYPQQSDLCVGKSANEELWVSAHDDGLFDSERFSRCGETFCYIKLDGSEFSDDVEFEDKSGMEDALDEVLRPAGLGCHIGGGTGKRYSYIDLALTDVEAGIKAVQQRLRQANVPKRAWIQFYDSDWSGEWVGIHDDSPAPLMELD